MSRHSLDNNTLILFRMASAFRKAISKATLASVIERLGLVQNGQVT
jgi:hypothetical protein